MPQKIILSIGQCGYDDSRLAQLAGAAGAKLATAAAGDEALQLIHVTPPDLILVNRVFDSTGDSGVDFIAGLRDAGVATPIMLVSNYPDAQAAAIANGALPGFGKSQIDDVATQQRIQKALSTPRPA